MSFIKKVLLEELRGVLWLIVAALLTIYLVLGRNYSVLMVHGQSMEPTYENRSFVIADKTKDTWTPTRFDVVIVEDSETGEKLAKRIIALGGETVHHKDGAFYVNGKKLEEDVHEKGEHLFIEKTKIPRGCIFVIGDNRGDSMFGIFMIEEVRGEVIINI
jgi:signal peptidase I